MYSALVLFRITVIQQYLTIRKPATMIESPFTAHLLLIRYGTPREYVSHQSLIIVIQVNLTKY